MRNLIDRDDLYKALAQWDWQDLYLPVHFKELVDDLPVERHSYEDGVRKGYEDAVRHYAKMALRQWISVTTRQMDEEERREWSEKLGYDIEYEDAVIYTSQLPDDGQEVLTCNRYGNIAIDKFENDPDYGCCFEENGDMDGIVAWMPLPEPYKEGEK